MIFRNEKNSLDFSIPVKDKLLNFRKNTNNFLMLEFSSNNSESIKKSESIGDLSGTDLIRTNIMMEIISQFS